MFQRHHRDYISKSATFNILPATTFHIHQVPPSTFTFNILLATFICIENMLENGCLTEAPFFNASLWKEGCKKNIIYKNIIKK